MKTSESTRRIIMMQVVFYSMESILKLFALMKRVKLRQNANHVQKMYVVSGNFEPTPEPQAGMMCLRGSNIPRDVINLHLLQIYKFSS